GPDPHPATFEEGNRSLYNRKKRWRYPSVRRFTRTFKIETLAFGRRNGRTSPRDPHSEGPSPFKSPKIYRRGWNSHLCAPSAFGDLHRGLRADLSCRQGDGRPASRGLAGGERKNIIESGATPPGKMGNVKRKRECLGWTFDWSLLF